MWQWYEVLQLVAVCVLFTVVVMEARQALREGMRE